MSKIFKNSLFLLLVQISGYIIPLIELPFLARVLSPNVLGQIIFIQVVALTASFFVEYGFNLKAARDFAQCNHDHDQRAKLIAIVFQAKIILFSLIVVLFVIAYQFIDIFSEKIPSQFVSAFYFIINWFWF